jgi:putative heme transporter
MTAELVSAGAIAGAQVVAPAQPTVARGAIVRRAVALIGILVVVFGIVLPRLVDYDAVHAALAGLTPTQLALLVLATVAAYVANAGPYRVLIPGLAWPNAVRADLAAHAVASTVPGPTDVATRYVLYRQWSVPADVANAGIVLAGLLETLSGFALPVIASVGLLAADAETRDKVLLLAVTGLLVLIVAAVLLVSIVRSERIARGLGDRVDRIARRVWALVGRTPPSGIAGNVLNLRRRSKAMLTQRGVAAFVAAVISKLAWFAVFEVALWCVGVGPDALPPATVLAAVAVVGMVSIVPLTPGGVGVSEVAYVGILSSAAGAAMAPQLTAAVSLFRIAQWLAPIPIGWVLLVFMRRGRSEGLLGPLDGALPGSTA